MNELETAIANALASEGARDNANKAYLEFIKANFIVPIERDSAHDEPRVLYLEDGECIFLPAFTNREILQAWAQSVEAEIQLLQLTGVNLLKGIGEHVTVSLNIGSPLYKEFNPAELARMRSMVMKFFS
jgi:hypothetical protein